MQTQKPPRSTSGNVRPALLRVSLQAPREEQTVSKVSSPACAKSFCPVPRRAQGIPGKGVLACNGLQELGRDVIDVGKMQGEDWPWLSWV